MKDAADLHVERWRDHWVLDERFDDDVEAATYRIGVIVKWLRGRSKVAVAEAGLQDFEYETLHSLMIRDTPGKASPGELAKAMGVSNAGVTGRLDTLESKGWLQRLPGAGDRRKVAVEITRSGVAIWREALRRRGSAEDEIAAVLTRAELATLNRLLKKMTLHAEAQRPADPT